MKKFGLEQEFFVKNRDGEIIIPETLKLNLPLDGCGYLVEARSKPYSSIYEAVYSLMAEVHRLSDLIEGSNHCLSYHPVEKLTKEFLFKISKQYVKGLTKYNNLYGFINHKIKHNERTAGIHISITDTRSYISKDAPVFNFNQNFDYISIFKKLDKEFEAEIKAAKRNKGFYEVKDDGRIEYRSLPSNVDPMKIINVLKDIK